MSKTFCKYHLLCSNIPTHVHLYHLTSLSVRSGICWPKLYHVIVFQFCWSTNIEFPLKPLCKKHSFAGVCFNPFNSKFTSHIEGILPKGPYPPCFRMADMALFGRIPSIFHFAFDGAVVCLIGPQCDLFNLWLKTGIRNSRVDISWRPRFASCRIALDLPIHGLGYTHYSETCL